MFNKVISKKFDSIIIILIIFIHYFIGVYNETNLSIFSRRREGLFILFFPTLILIILNRKKIIESLKDNKVKLKIMIIIILSFILNQYYYSFYLLIMMLILDKEKSLKAFLYSSSFFYLLTIILYYSGVLERYGLQPHLRDYGEFSIYRNTLGFPHPNNVMMLLVPIITSIYYLYYNKMTQKIMLFIFILISGIEFYLTFSRTTFIVILFFIFLILIKDEYILKLKSMIYLELIGSLVLTFIVPVFFYSEKINRLLSTRLALFRDYILNYGISLFGDRNIAKIYKEVPLDNLYLRIFIEHGIIGILLFILMIIIVIRKLYQYEDTKAIRILASIILFSIFESQGFQYYFNILLFIVPSYIYFDSDSKVIS